MKTESERVKREEMPAQSLRRTRPPIPRRQVPTMTSFAASGIGLNETGTLRSLPSRAAEGRDTAEVMIWLEASDGGEAGFSADSGVRASPAVMAKTARLVNSITSERVRGRRAASSYGGTCRSARAIRSSVRMTGPDGSTSGVRCRIGNVLTWFGELFSHTRFRSLRCLRFGLQD